MKNKMIALQGFDYAGKKLVINEEFEADDIPATLLKMNKRARYKDDQSEIIPRSKKTYNHRMLTADTNFSDNAFHPDNNKPKTRRGRLTRRDLKVKGSEEE